MAEERTGVVVDTNVILDAIWYRDQDCSNVIYKVREQHTMVVCKKLLDEYGRKLAAGSLDMRWVSDRRLMESLPVELMENHADPTEEIDFGPPEDRFHMQLAISAGARCHITKDEGVLAHARKMRRHGVKQVRPMDCTACYQ